MEETKFAIIDNLADGDWFDEMYDTEEEAVAAAEQEWKDLSAFDKNRRHSFYVAEVEINDDGEIERECRIVKTFKSWR